MRIASPPPTRFEPVSNHWFTYTSLAKAGIIHIYSIWFNISHYPLWMQLMAMLNGDGGVRRPIQAALAPPASWMEPLRHFPDWNMTSKFLRLKVSVYLKWMLQYDALMFQSNALFCPPEIWWIREGWKALLSPHCFVLVPGNAPEKTFLLACRLSTWTRIWGNLVSCSHAKLHIDRTLLLLGTLLLMWAKWQEKRLSLIHIWRCRRRLRCRSRWSPYH